jgi:hypothetical protein
MKSATSSRGPLCEPAIALTRGASATLAAASPGATKELTSRRASDTAEI